MYNVGFVSLGCSKNLVVTEEVIGIFKKNNFNIVNNENDADIIVINTCGFIESAKEEAIDCIFEMAEYKKKRCKYLIVIRLSSREIQRRLREVNTRSRFIYINKRIRYAMGQGTKANKRR